MSDAHEDGPMSLPLKSDPSASLRFTDRVAVVTGGGGGLGSAICARFVAEGGKVAIFDAQLAAAESEAAALPADRALAFGVDVRDRQAVEAAVQETVQAFGRIDVLIAAAGGSLGTPRDIADITEEDLDLVLDVNIKGTYHCAVACIPHMRVTGNGAIVTFSSIGGRTNSPVTGVPYAAAKAGLLGLTRRLAREVGPDGIRVNAIAPGLFLTDRLQGMFDGMQRSEQQEVIDSIPLRRMPTIEECVAPVLFLASDDASYITGVVLDVNGGRFMAG